MNYAKNTYKNGDVATVVITPNDEVGEVKIKVRILSGPNDDLPLRRYMVEEITPKYFKEPIWIFDFTIIEK